VLEKYPDSQEAQEARMGLAMSYHEDKDFTKEREQYDAVIKAAQGVHTPQGFQAMGMKLRSYMDEKKFPEALKEALATSDTLRGIPPEAEGAKKGLQIILIELYVANKQNDKAFETGRAIIARWPDDAELHFNSLQHMAQIDLMQNEPAKAAGLIADYLQAHPNAGTKSKLLTVLADMQHRAGQNAPSDQSYDAAEAELKAQIDKALGADAKTELRFALAQVRQQRGHLAEARQELEGIIKDSPAGDAKPAAKMELMRMAMGENKIDEALGLLREVARENPDTQWAMIANQTLQQIQALRDRQMATTGTLGLARPTTGTLATTGTLPAGAAAATTPTQPAAPAATAQPAQADQKTSGEAAH
jgi:outer membrane protein assembly factor BamD (BamD/ComL family)